LRLISGETVDVIGLKKGTVDGTPALVLTYQTNKDIADTVAIPAEMEKVWIAFRPLVEQHHYDAAVVFASENAHPFGNGVPLDRIRTVGWHWKKRSDGQWQRL
jgi:hypothetical protein